MREGTDARGGLIEARAWARELMRELAANRAAYDKHKAYLVGKDVDDYNIKTDPRLKELSDGAKTIATILSGINAFVQTEVWVGTYVRTNGTKP